MAVAVVVAVIAVVLTVLMTGVLATIAGGLLGPGSRRGRDFATIAVAAVISLLATGAALLPSLISALRHRSAPGMADTVRWLPTGWGPDAVAAAARSDWGTVALALVGLVAVTVAAALLWPTVLGRRMLLLLVGSQWHLSWATWTAVPVGVATGAVLAYRLGAIAVTRLATDQVSTLRTLVRGV